MMDIISCDIRTICIGKAMSAGQFIFSSGKKGKRFMSKHARLMVHNPIAGMEGSCPDLEIEIEELLKCRQLFLQHLSDKSGQTPEFLKDLIDRNRYVDAEESIRLGFADGMLKTIK
jgi:ATP-dependent Clp protease protease subunit